MEQTSAESVEVMATDRLVLSEDQLEAGELAFYEWRSLGGSEWLGSADLVRRIAAVVLGVPYTENESNS